MLRRLCVSLCVAGTLTAIEVNAQARVATEDVPGITHVRWSDRGDVDGADPELDDRGWPVVAVHEIDPQARLVWVRTHIPGDRLRASQVPLAVYVSAMAAYEVFWNGVPIGRSGMPASVAGQERPGFPDTQHHVPPHLIQDGDNVLALRMSTFHLRRHLVAPVHYVGIGEYGRLGQEALRTRLPVVALAGALLLGAVYFAGLFVLDRRDWGSLLLSALSLGVLVQLGSELWRTITPYRYPVHITRLEVIFVASAACGLLLVGCVTLQHAPRYRWPLLVLAGAGMVAATLMPGFDERTALAMLAALMAVIVAAMLGLRSGSRGAGATAAVTLVLAGWLLLDPDGFVDRNGYFAAAGCLLLLFAGQSVDLRTAQAVRAAAELRSTRLDLELTKRHLHPHFLVNSLTALAEWVETDPATGVRMIDALAAEYRALAAASGQRLIPLAAEVQMCRHHLDVMSLRKGCAFRLDVVGTDSGFQIPPGVLHTLLENALTHNRYAQGAVFVLHPSTSGSGRRVYRLESPLDRAAPKGRSGLGGRGHAFVRALLEEAWPGRWTFTSGPEKVAWVDSIAATEA